MVDDSDGLPPRRTVYRATKTSLAFARSVADSMGLEFDEEEVKQLSDNLFEVMYADLIGLLDLSSPPPRLDAASYSVTQVFLALDDEQRPTIVLDMIFDYWLFAMTHLTTIVTFNAMTLELASRVTAVYEDVLGLFLNGAAYKPVRALVAPYISSYPRELNLSSAMSRAMTVFALCHEIAHAELGHLGKPGSREQEDDADRLAAEYFLTVVRKQEAARKTHVYVDPKVAGSPIVMMRLFGLLEAWMSARSLGGAGSSVHAPALERETRIRALLAPTLVDVAHEIVAAHEKGIAELQRELTEE